MKKKTGQPKLSIECLTEKTAKVFDRFLCGGSPCFDGCNDDKPYWTFSATDEERSILYDILEVLNMVVSKNNAQKKAAKKLKKELA